MKKLSFTLPKSWDELSDAQLLQVVRVMHTVPVGRRQDFLLLKCLLNIKPWHFYQKAKLKLLLLNVPISEIKTHFNFLFTENTRTVFIKNIKVKGKVLTPPMDRIINLNAAEFAAAHDLNNKFMETKDPEYLRYLLAVLYTPFPRPEFDKLELEAKAKQFKNVSDIKLLAVHICFTGCVNNLAKRFKKAFPKTNGKTKSKYGFGKIILQMCRQDLAKYDSISKINIYTFLEQFQEDIQNAKKK